VKSREIVECFNARIAAENRLALRDCNIVKHIMIFLAQNKFQELHVFAVMVLLSCVEDTNIVKVVSLG